MRQFTVAEYILDSQHSIEVSCQCSDQYILGVEVVRSSEENVFHSDFQRRRLASLSAKRAARVRFPLNPLVFRKVEFYHCVIHSFPPVPTTGSKKAVHVLLCLCNNACKRSLVICRKSRALCPVSRLLPVPI